MTTIKTEGMRTEVLSKRTREMMASGHEVILVIKDTAPPEKVLKMIHACVGDNKIDLVVRCAEVREYLENAVNGGVIGAGAAAWSVVLVWIAGGTVSFPLTLTVIGIGALLGATIGAGVTPISEVIVYRYRGNTRIKIIPA